MSRARVGNVAIVSWERNSFSASKSSYRISPTLMSIARTQLTPRDVMVTILTAMGEEQAVSWKEAPQS